MKNGSFTLWHSLISTGLLVIVEGSLLMFVQHSLGIWILLLAAAIGAIGNIYVSTEVIEEVRNAWHMLWLLSAIVTEFVLFFAFQYGYLLFIQPESFPTLLNTPISLVLNSVMVFVFNPLFMPATEWGQSLLLVNTLGALGLVLFILQNIGQFRKAR